MNTDISSFEFEVSKNKPVAEKKATKDKDLKKFLVKPRAGSRKGLKRRTKSHISLPRKAKPRVLATQAANIGVVDPAAHQEKIKALPAEQQYTEQKKKREEEKRTKLEARGLVVAKAEEIKADEPKTYNIDSSNKGRELAKLRKTWGKRLPPVVCNNCSYTAQCPQFKPDYECAYMGIISGTKVDSQEDMKQAQLRIIEANMTTAELGLIQQRLSGGVIDDKTSHRLDAAFEQLAEARRLAFTAHQMGGERVTIQGEGLLAKIFGSLGAKVSDAKTEPLKQIEGTTKLLDVPASMADDATKRVSSEALVPIEQEAKTMMESMSGGSSRMANIAADEIADKLSQAQNEPEAIPEEKPEEMAQVESLQEKDIATEPPTEKEKEFKSEKEKQLDDLIKGMGQ